jgi:basic amino acid/polyamine antiporter, APA family
VLQLRRRVGRRQTLDSQQPTATPTPIAAVPTLRRALGRWDLTAIGINQTIGGAVFLMPSQIAAAVGAWSPIAVLAGTLVTMIVALSLAEVGSRFDATGGPYLYARAAFGRFVSFEVGWMQWFTRVTSHASVANGLALALGYYWAGASSGAWRIAIIAGVTAVLTLLNILGIRQGARTVNALTFAKLVPLALFIAAGLFFVSPARFTALPAVSFDQASTAALLIIFVFGGYEVLTVPAGEANDPRRHVPFALVTTIVVVGTVTILAQVVAVGTLDNLAASKTPLADAAATFMGGPGALLIGLGALASMTGNLAGQILTGSRMIFALAERGDLPRVFARIHPVYRTPVTSILFTAGVALVLAVSGSFAWLAIASAVARLITYAASCGAAVAFSRPSFGGRVGAAAFVTPGSPAVPLLGTVVALGLIAGASRSQLAAGLAALAAGAAIFFISRRRPDARLGSGEGQP